MIKSTQPSMQFFNNLTPSQIKRFLKMKLPICEECLTEKKSHYCIQNLCTKKQLICVNCDTLNIYSNHYTHNYVYIVPLLMKNIFSNFTEIIDNLNDFKSTVLIQIKKIENYIKDLGNVVKLVDNMLENLIKEKQTRKFDEFQKQIIILLNDKSHQKVQLEKVFDNVNFISNAQCKLKNDTFKKDLVNQINKLVWLTDPQKAFKQFLAEKQEIEPKQQLACPVNKTIEISEIDTNFKNCYEILTNKMKYNPVNIKFQNQYSNKLKIYESLMYHFKKSKRLILYNVSINHIKSVLTYQNLQYLEFVCNPQAEPYFQKLQHENKIISFTVKKLKQQDCKFLRYIRIGFPHLKELHIQFINKFDMSNNKDLIQFFKGENKHLRRLTIKFRTQNQIKRLYGHFTKFYRQSYQNNFQDVFLNYLYRHKNLTRLNIQGVKINKHKQLICTMKNMPFLMDFKLVLEGASEYGLLSIRNVSKILEKRALHQRKLILILTKMYKTNALNKYNRNLTTQIFNQFILQ